MGEHVLVIGGGREIPSLLRRHQPGSRTSVLCQLSLVPKLREVTAHERVVAFRPDSEDGEWIEAARRIHAEDPVTAVATFGERDQSRAAVVAAALGLTGHAPQTVAAVHDKALMRRVLAEAGIEEVRSSIVDSAAPLAGWLKENPGRWVVKPLDGSGSAGVSIVSDPEEAPAAYARCTGSSHTGRSGSAGVLVEEYLDGVQVSVESLSEGGEHCVVAVTRKYSDPRTLVELGHVVPSGLPREPVVEYTGRLLTTLGVRNGVCHTELVLTPRGPRTIETHLRLAGDEIPYLVRDAVGVDLVDCVVRQTFGEPVLASVRERLAFREVTPQAIWFGAAPCAGTLVRIDFPDLPDVHFEQKIPDGDEVTELRDSDSRPLWARASGPDPQTAVRRAFEAVDACTMIVSVPLIGPGGFDAAV
jgi:biotin carboxylase